MDSIADKLKYTRDFLDKLEITRPVLLLDENKTRENIRNMAAKVPGEDVELRPHFKTHQSAEIGKWFQEYGVEKITVSSVEMAVYFTENGWKDITIAFPVNIREIDVLNKLAKKIKLNLLVESEEVIDNLEKEIKAKTGIWIKINTGYNRAGIHWTEIDIIQNLAQKINKTENLRFLGVLTHAGNTYSAKSTDEIKILFKESAQRLIDLKNDFYPAFCKASSGDTPGCKIVDSFDFGLDEIRPGNYVFHDLTQYFLGACTPEEISVCMACPVVAKYPVENRLMIHGGGVHFSKEFLEINGKKTYGFATVIKEGSWGEVLNDVSLISISQEHGVISAPDQFLDNIDIGDLILIYPVHSCLTANLMKDYKTLDGRTISTINSKIYIPIPSM